MLTSTCDFLEFTVPAERRPELMHVLPGGFVPLDKGWRGYSHAGLVAGGKGMMGWNPERPDMGCHVSLGSQALDILGELDAAWANRPGVCEFIQGDLEGRVTRFDAAFDDRQGALDMDVIEGALKAGEYTSRWKAGQVVLGLGQSAGGRSFYLGSPRSDARLLIYDKAAERAAKGEAVQGPWVRVELRLRRERANTAAALFSRAVHNAKEVMAHLAGVLRGYVEFKVPNATDSNKRRWEPAAWWVRFLGDVEKARLEVPQQARRTVDDVKGWISFQVSPSLALLEDALGFDRAWSFLYAEAQEGRARMGPRHKAILAASG